MALGVSVCTFMFAIIRARIAARNCSPSTKRLPHAQAIAGSDRESNAKNANGCKICSIFPPTISFFTLTDRESEGCGFAYSFVEI